MGKAVEVIDSSLGENVDFSNETEALIAEERNNSSLNNSRSTSPSKAIRRTTDINLLLPEINSLLTKRKNMTIRHNSLIKERCFRSPLIMRRSESDLQ